MKTASFGIAAVVAVLATPAFAQTDEPRVRVSFGGGITGGAIDGAASLAASAGYRFSNHFSFDVEVTAADSAADRFANRVFPLDDAGDFGAGQVGNLLNAQRGNRFGGPQNRPIAPGDLHVDNEGSTVLATAGFRYEMPVQGTRFRPYVSGGMGVSRTEETFRATLAPEANPGAPGRPGANRPNTRPIIKIDKSLTHTGLVAGGGVGASLRVFKELSVDIDARYFRMDQGRNVGWFGGGVSYRF